MATDVFEGGGLVVTRKAGPASEGGDRARWQLTTPLPEGHATLDRHEATALCIALAESLGGAGYIIPEPQLGDDHSASRRVDVLEREAPHLLAPSSRLGEVAPIAWPEEEA